MEEINPRLVNSNSSNITYEKHYEVSWSEQKLEINVSVLGV
jgi:hypothetical protein